MKRLKKTERVGWAFLALGWGLLGGFMAWRLQVERGRMGAAEEAHLSQQARIIDENLGWQLKAVNNALRSLQAELPALDQARKASARLNQRLETLCSAMPGVRTTPE